MQKTSNDFGGGKKIHVSVSQCRKSEGRCAHFSLLMFFSLNVKLLLHGVSLLDILTVQSPPLPVQLTEPRQLLLRPMPSVPSVCGRQPLRSDASVGWCRSLQTLKKKYTQYIGKITFLFSSCGPSISANKQAPP